MMMLSSTSSSSSSSSLSPLSLFSPAAFAAGLLVLVQGFCVVSSYEDTCTQFKNIYASGTELCEKMWDDSFKVVPDEYDDEDLGYTMWFFDMEHNPNNDVTERLFGQGTVPNQCHLQYYHKETPSPEDDGMRECHPWKNNACCDSTTTVKSVDTINEGYGDGYQWDRCGPMSQACERFFVMEACFYECDPNAGLFRKYNQSLKGIHKEYNEWQLHKMPIKKSFCDSWYTACYHDYFCGKGSFFECAAYYEDVQKAVAAGTINNNSNEGLIIGLSVTGALALLGIMFAFVLVHKEKQGKPMFAMDDTTTRTGAQEKADNPEMS